jgi:hypothetical protein
MQSGSQAEAAATLREAVRLYSAKGNLVSANTAQATLERLSVST